MNITNVITREDTMGFHRAAISCMCAECEVSMVIDTNLAIDQPNDSQSLFIPIICPKCDWTSQLHLELNFGGSISGNTNASGARSGAAGSPRVR